MNDFIETKTAQEKAEENARHRIETAYYVRDLIVKSEDTKQLYAVFLDILKVRKAEMLQVMMIAEKTQRMSGNDDSITVPFEEKDFWEHVGLIEGLDFLSQEVEWQIDKANQDEQQKERKNGKN